MVDIVFKVFRWSRRSSRNYRCLLRVFATYAWLVKRQVRCILWGLAEEDNLRLLEVSPRV